MNFVKLKKNLDIGQYSIHETHSSYGLIIDGTFRGIKYSSVKTDIEQQLFELIPEQHRCHFIVAAMEVNVKIPPHIDSKITATINFYIKTDNCLTQFYSLNTRKPKTKQIENQTTGHLFEIEDLEEVDNFIAKPGEIWVLDVSKPHSVIPCEDGDINRVALCLQNRKFNFDEILELLKSTGNL